MRRAWPILAVCGIAALNAAQPASATCASWRIASEMSLRHAEGWTMLRLSQHGDRLSGSARRPAGADGRQAEGLVQGRLDSQRLWLKISWPDGSEIFDGTIGPNGDARGTRISAQGRQDGAAWEAIEPLQCLAMSAGPQAGSGWSAAAAEPTLDEFTRAARDIFGILSGDQPQQPAPAQADPPPSPGTAGTDPFGTSAPAGQSGNSDPFGSPAPAGQGGNADPFGPPPSSSDGGSSDPFGPPPSDTGGPGSPPPGYGQIDVPPASSTGAPRTLPPSAFEDRPMDAGRPKGGAKSLPHILIPIGPFDATCAPGFVWREARPSDHVCVPPPARDRVKGENFFARSNRDTKSLDGCTSPFVWRDAWAGDRTCVTASARDLAAEENRLGPSRRANN